MNNAQQIKSLSAKLKVARSAVQMKDFGTPVFEAKMQIVRALCEKIDSIKPKEEFCSIDSGWHRTRLLSGKVI